MFEQLKKKCKYCRKMFPLDKRVWKRQKACSSAECQRLRKKESNQAFKKANPDYWKGRYDDLKTWRVKNPHYQQQWHKRKKEEAKTKNYSEIQAERVSYVIDSIEKNMATLREIQAEIFLQPIDFKRQMALSGTQAP